MNAALDDLSHRRRLNPAYAHISPFTSDPLPQGTMQFRSTLLAEVL